MGFQHYTTATFFTGVAPWVGLENYTHGHPLGRVRQGGGATRCCSPPGRSPASSRSGLALALYFQRRFPLSGLLRSLLLLPWLIPLIVSSAVWRWILDQDNGALNRVLSALHLVVGHPGWLTSTSLALIAVIMVNIWIGIPFNTTILYGGLQEIPRGALRGRRAGRRDGWKAFRHITWPLLRPVVNVVLVLGVVYTLKVIDIILGLTRGGPANATQTIATQSYSCRSSQFDFGQGAAMGNILIVISLVFASFYLRASRQGAEDVRPRPARPTAALRR